MTDIRMRTAIGFSGMRFKQAVVLVGTIPGWVAVRPKDCPDARPILVTFQQWSSMPAESAGG